MSYQIDHVFVLTADYPLAVDELQTSGFSVAPRRDHPGQGTANRCVYLENGYVELLWVDRRDEAVSALTRPVGLDERSRWIETSASPIGIALRGPADMAPPFPCWSYRPRYLPDGAEILIADEPVDLGAPLVFIIPSVLKGHGIDFAQANGTHRITSIAISGPVPPDTSPALVVLQENGLCNVNVATAPALRVEFDHGHQGRTLELNPQTPLTLSW